MICECGHAEFRHNRGVCLAAWREGLNYITCDCINFKERAHNDQAESAPTGSDIPIAESGICSAIPDAEEWPRGKGDSA